MERGSLGAAALLSMESMMTDEHQALATELLQRALDGTEEPARAVSILMSAAATILQRTFSEEAAIELMVQALDTAGAAWRQARAH